MSIEWGSTIDNPPIPGKEIIAKNPLKLTNDYSSGKSCKIMKFHHSFTKEQILDEMLNSENNFSLWSYTG
jgi:hypothetical protein